MSLLSVLNVFCQNLLRINFFFIIIGKQEGADAIIAALEVLNEPFKSMAKTMVDICAYAGENFIVFTYKMYQFLKLI